MSTYETDHVMDLYESLKLALVRKYRLNAASEYLVLLENYYVINSEARFIRKEPLRESRRATKIVM